MLKIADEVFIINTFKDLEEKMGLMNEKMVHLNRKTQTIKNNQQSVAAHL